MTDSTGRTATTSRAVTVSNAAPAPAPTGSVTVFITQPTGGATVSSTAWIVLWVEGTSGTANSFTLSVDGVDVETQTTLARGPVTIAWRTNSVANGNHVLTGAVTDAVGNRGTTSITVAVRN